MNLGLIVSYIIAGMLMIIIISIGYSTNYSGNELTLQQYQKERISNVVEMITYDMPKIGYNLNSLPDTLLRRVGDTYIEFYSNIDNSADESLELVRWEFTTDSIPDTENPNDYFLRRTVSGGSVNETTQIAAGVTSFDFNFYTQLGSNTQVSLPIDAATNKSGIDNIIQIEILMISQSPVPLQFNSSSTPRYVTSSWSKRFSPVNLRDY